MNWHKGKDLKLGDIILGVRDAQRSFMARGIVLSVTEKYVDIQWSWGDMEWFSTKEHEFIIEEKYQDA